MSAPRFEFLKTQLMITEEFDFSAITELRQKFEASPSPNFAALEQQRQSGSNTINKNQDLNSWRQANQLLAKWIAEDENLNFNKVLKLNMLLNPNRLGYFREGPIYAAAGEFLDAQDLVYVEDYFDNVIMKLPLNPLLRASMIYQSLVSFHPFTDGNGRTARLAADFFLIQSGYVPLSFENPFDAMCAITSNGLYINGNYGMQKTLKWLENSYKLLLL